MLYLFSLFRFLTGAAVYSFGCCTADRCLRNESIVSGRSHCDHCGHVLAFFELIPVLSYLLLRGKCRRCGELIPVHVFLWELSGGILCMTMPQWCKGNTAQQWLLFLYLAVLAVMSRIDRKTYRIPVFLQYWSLVPVVLDLFLMPEMIKERVISFCVVVLLYLLNRVFAWMGDGDLKMLGIGSLLFGSRILMVFAVSMVAGLPVIVWRKIRRERTDRLPYVPLYTCGVLAVSAGLEDLLFVLFSF